MQIRIRGGPFDGQIKLVPAPSRLLVLPVRSAHLDEEDVQRLGPAVTGYTAVYEQDGDEDSTDYSFVEFRSR